MNNLVNALPIMVNNYSKLFGVSVRIQGTCAYTNGKVITIPRLDISDPTKARLAYGYLAHEASHVRYTDFALLEKTDLKNDFFLFSLFNILEDSRIEALIAKEYIGVYENLSLLNDYYEKDWRTFCNTLSAQEPIKVLFCFIQCYAQAYCQKFFSSRKRAALLFFHLKKRFDAKVLNRIALISKQCAKAKSSSDVLALCRQIYSILKHQCNAFKENGGQSEMDSLKSNDALLTEYREIEQQKGLAQNEYQKRLYLEEAKFKLGTKSDIGNVTPSKSLSKIVEENCASSSTSSREDFGLCKEIECRKGDSNFINTVENTYGIRNALHYHVKSYVEAFAHTSFVGKKLCPKKAQKIFLGENKIFKNKEQQQDFSTSVHILVDVSSSMLTTDGLDKTRADEACSVALSLCLALDGIDGVYSMATYFPGLTTEFEIAKRSHERTSSISARFDQKPRGSTPLAQGLWYAFEKAHKLECNRNIILVITDGMPDSICNVENAFIYANKNNIEVYGISIRSNHVKGLFKKATVIENASQLQRQVFSLFHELFSINKGIDVDIH